MKLWLDKLITGVKFSPNPIDTLDTLFIYQIIPRNYIPNALQFKQQQFIGQIISRLTCIIFFSPCVLYDLPILSVKI